MPPLSSSILVLLGLVIACLAEHPLSHDEWVAAHPEPTNDLSTRDQWHEDIHPRPPHAHATNVNQVRESWTWSGGAGDETTSACLVSKNSEWEGYDCSQGTCKQYAGSPTWGPDLEACCNADQGEYDCTADWCLDKKWGSAAAKAAVTFWTKGFFDHYYSCNDSAMDNYCKEDSEWYTDASECCPKRCGV